MTKLFGIFLMTLGVIFLLPVVFGGLNITGFGMMFITVSLGGGTVLVSRK